MTNRLELNWKLDGFVDEQHYYCSETLIDPENPPTPKAVLAGDVRTYTDTAIDAGKTYYVAVSSVKNLVEKISAQIEIQTTKVYVNTFKNTDNIIKFGTADLTANALDGGLTVSTTATNDTLIQLTDAPTCKNFEAEFDLTHISTGTNTSLVFVYRTSTWISIGSVAYAVGYSGGRTLYWSKGTNSASNSQTNIKLSYNIVASATVKHKIKYIVQDDLHSFYIDDVLKDTITDTSHLLSGGFGFRLYADRAVSILIENLKITSLD